NAQRIGEHIHQHPERRSLQDRPLLAVRAHGIGHSALALRRRYFEFGPALREDERECVHLLRLVMHHQLKALSQKRLHHSPDLVSRRVGALSRSDDIKLVGIGPYWSPLDADTLNGVGLANDLPEFGGLDIQSPVIDDQRHNVRTGRRFDRFDRSYFETRYLGRTAGYRSSEG